MSLFSSFVGSLTTGAGQNARNAQLDQQKNALAPLYQWLQAYNSDPQGDAAQLRGAEQMQIQALMAAFNSLQGQGGQQGLGDAFAGSAGRDYDAGVNRELAAARGAGITDAGTLAAIGGGDALKRSRAKAGGRAQGNQQYLQNQQGALQALAGILGTYQNRQGNIGNALAPIMGQQLTPVGPSFASGIGQLAGMAANYFGGGVGGGGGAPSPFGAGNQLPGGFSNTKKTANPFGSNPFIGFH